MQWVIRHSEVEFTASVIEYDVPMLILESTASATTMRAPTTLVAYSEAHESDYFNSSVTYDVQTNMVRRMLWSEITDMDSDQCPNASIAENSDTKNSTTFERKKSVHHTNETIDCDIKPSKRPESRRECQWSTCTTREERIDPLHRLSSLLFAQCVQSWWTPLA